MNIYKVQWTKAALQDFKDIISLDSPGSAKKIYQKIKKQVQKLKQMPERFKALAELKEIGINSYREVSITPYRVIYQVAEKKVYVIAVVDGRRIFQDIIFKRLVRFD